MDVAAFDPGLHGAAALLRHDINRHGRLAYRFIDIVDIPSIEDGERRPRVNVPFIGTLLERWGPDVVVIEAVGVPIFSNRNPGADKGFRQSPMSSSDAFQFGKSCGRLEGCVEAYGFEPVMANPRSWTSALGLKGGDKKPHAALIKQLVPSAAEFITLAKHDGRADAACMAYWYAQKRGML